MRNHDQSFFLRPNNFIIFKKAGFFLIIAIKRVLRFLGANFCVVVYIIFISEFTHNKVWTRILRFNYHISIHDRPLILVGIFFRIHFN